MRATASRFTPVQDSRRRFLKAAGAATGATALGFPLVAKAAPRITLRFQTSWQANDIFQEFARDYARKVFEMSDGRLRLHMLPANAAVPTFRILDAVARGTLDGGHGVVANWTDKNPAYSLFGTGPSFGMDANMLLGWMEYGGGYALYHELHNRIMHYNVRGLLYGPMPTQPLGWFRRPVTGPEDLRGLRFRTLGLAAELFREMGMHVIIMPGTQIVPALRRGSLDAAEYNNPSSDRALGLPEVRKTYMLRSYHSRCECFELLFNGARYRQLGPELQAIVKYAAQAASADMSWKAMQRYSHDLAAMQAEQGVKVNETPDSVFRAEFAAWDKVVERHSRDPFFAQIIASQRAWARRVVDWSLKTNVDPALAYRHYFHREI